MLDDATSAFVARLFREQRALILAERQFVRSVETWTAEGRARIAQRKRLEGQGKGLREASGNSP